MVGAGAWSTRSHLPAMKRIQAAGLAEYPAVCDLDEAKAKPYAAELDAASYADLDAMVREVRPDGLALIVGPAAMADVILRAVEHRVPFLCEKPPAPDLATHRRLVEAAGDLPHATGYNRRSSPYLAKAKEWLAGERLQTVTVHFTRHRRHDPDFTTTAVHGIDTAVYLAGPLASARIETAPAGAVQNVFINGWTAAGTRVDITVLPDTGSAQEHYICRSADRTVRVAYPQHPMIDYPGYVERHEGNQVIERLSHADFGLEADDLPALIGILGEQELFARMLAGEAEPISTLETSLHAQELREPLQHLPRDRVSSLDFPHPTI